MLKRPSILFSTNRQKKDNIPLRHPNLNINWLNAERESSIKFQGVWIDEMSWASSHKTEKNPKLTKTYFTYNIQSV